MRRIFMLINMFGVVIGFLMWDILVVVRVIFIFFLVLSLFGFGCV